MVESTMPHSPESLKTVVIEDASTHVINDMYSIKFGPYSCCFPNDKKFVPNEHKMKKRKYLHF